MKRPVIQAAGVIILMVAAFMAGHITTAVSQTGPTLKRPPDTDSTVKPPRTPSPKLRLKKYQCAHGFDRREKKTQMSPFTIIGVECSRRIVTTCIGSPQPPSELKIRKVGNYYEVYYHCLFGESQQPSPW